MARISDKAPQILNVNLASVPLGLVPVARLKDGDDILNKTRYSGKRFSSVIIAEGPFDYVDPGVGHSIMMALGQGEGLADGTTVPGDSSNWISLGLNTLDAVITPTAPTYDIRPKSDSKPNMGKGRVEGNGADSWHQLLNALEFPVVDVADLLDGTSMINNRHYSGKGRGRFVIAHDAGDYTLVFASGGLYNSTWHDLGGTSLGPIVGGPMADETRPSGDGKPKLYNARCVSLVSSYVTNAEIASITSELNAGGINEGGKRQGAIYFAADDWSAPTLANVALLVAFGPQPDAAWSNLDGVSGTITPA